MNLDQSSKIYSNRHKVDVFTESGLGDSREVMINIDKKGQSLEVKLRDGNDFSFNYTAIIDWQVFERMKSEQHLEICFEEFYSQFVHLLQQTLSREMLLRLEQNDRDCKMIFYEKSRIKSLILLVIDLVLTDQNDIIKEMTVDMNRLKQLNRNTAAQLESVRNQLQEKDAVLNTTLTSYQQIRKKFIEDIKCIEDTFKVCIDKVHRHISIKVDSLNTRYDRLLEETIRLKNEYKYRENIYNQAMFQLEQFKNDNEKNYSLIDKLKCEIESLNRRKLEDDRRITDLSEILGRKDTELDSSNLQIAELKKDIQEASVIIAQKTKTHDEIAKDLVQANTMIVNFNNQCEMQSQEVAYLENTLLLTQEALQEEGVELNRVKEEFANYKTIYNLEKTNILQDELKNCRERIEELEKHNREAIKINGLLTKKLASSDLIDTTNMQRMRQK